jgi:ComF family protein
VLTRWIADWLSPPRCASCDAPLAISRAAFCPTCALTVDREDAASAPAASSPVVAFGAYGGALAVALRRLKYTERPDLARPLGELLASSCARAKLTADIVVPVPLYPARLLARGYNQASLLSAWVARSLGARLCAGALGRIIDTAAQAELPRDQRLANVSQAFRVVLPNVVAGRRIVVVDDVVTTGATLRACARALGHAGARAVRGAVVARTAGADQSSMLFRRRTE